jgi:hypothetical protein
MSLFIYVDLIGGWGKHGPVGSCQHTECIQIRLGRWNTPNILSVHSPSVRYPHSPAFNFSCHHLLYLLTYFLLEYLFGGEIQDSGFVTPTDQRTPRRSFHRDNLTTALSTNNSRAESTRDIA